MPVQAKNKMADAKGAFVTRALEKLLKDSAGRKYTSLQKACKGYLGEDPSFMEENHTRPTNCSSIAGFQSGVSCSLLLCIPSLGVSLDKSSETGRFLAPIGCIAKSTLRGCVLAVWCKGCHQVAAGCVGHKI